MSWPAEAVVQQLVGQFEWELADTSEVTGGDLA